MKLKSWVVFRVFTWLFALVAVALFWTLMWIWHWFLIALIAVSLILGAMSYYFMREAKKYPL